MEREKNERKKDGTCCVGPLAILANKLWQKSSKRWMKRSRTREKKTSTNTEPIYTIDYIDCFVCRVFRLLYYINCLLDRKVCCCLIRFEAECLKKLIFGEHDRMRSNFEKKTKAPSNSPEIYEMLVWNEKYADMQTPISFLTQKNRSNITNNWYIFILIHNLIITNWWNDSSANN